MQIRNILTLNKKNTGMTYVELIVVLSIFSIISAVSIFNYQTFQDKVDIKNLSNDIALKVVEAQKSSLSGRLPILAAANPDTWKPSYGLYFDLAPDPTNNPPNTGNKVFYYFVDLDQSKTFDHNGTYSCAQPQTNECLDKVSITKGNYIQEIKIFYQDSNGLPEEVLTNAAITFTRPNSGAFITSTNPVIDNLNRSVDRVEIKVSSPGPDPATALIKVYTSGRIQIN